MAVIEKKIELAGSKGRSEVAAIFDSGATYSCIRFSVAEKLGNLEQLPSPTEFGTAKAGERVSANFRVSLDIHIDGFRLSDEFMVIDGLSEETVIGAATLQKWRIKLDFEHDRVIIDPRVTKLRLL